MSRVRAWLGRPALTRGDLLIYVGGWFLGRVLYGVIF